MLGVGTKSLSKFLCPGEIPGLETIGTIGTAGTIVIVAVAVEVLFLVA